MRYPFLQRLKTITGFSCKIIAILSVGQGDKLYAEAMGEVVPLYYWWQIADDNNLVENSIRPVALGRKKLSVCRKPWANQDTAMLYSLFATCHADCMVSILKWLTHLFEKINVTAKNDLHLLLPQNYTAM